ncbi:MAG: hydrogenase maturation protease [Gammaproteobacteria bacterium]|nr:hydrogenase maturation protease [Gammaproteobacteria bacterium]
MPDREGDQKKVLVLGCGNPARGDDGVGPALINLLEQADFTRVEIRLDYQLRVEDALDIGNFQQVIFVDASKDARPPFEFNALTMDQLPTALDTHSTSPEALLYLAKTLFGAETPASILAIRGYAFEPFVESITPQAKKNLVLAFDHLSQIISRQD